VAERTESFADPTELASFFDLIGDSLSAARVRGSVLLAESYFPPWGVHIPGHAELAVLLGAPKGCRVVAFHMVEFGHCQIDAPDSARLALRAGDVVICFGGVEHSLSDGSGGSKRSIGELLGLERSGARERETGPSPGASLLCGVFFLQNAELGPLLSEMPSFTKVSLTGSGGARSLCGVARLLSEEVARRSAGGPFIVSRLLEALAAEVIRTFVSQEATQSVPLLRAIQDPALAKALSAFHVAPGFSWTVGRLASKANLSPSRFSARFASTLGDSPMAYVSKWRMVLARRMLAEGDQTVASVSETLGYESQAAFNRAFRKIVGVSPSRWKVGHSERK